MKRWCIITILAILLLIPSSYALTEVGIPERDNDEVTWMDVSVNYTKYGDNYLVDADVQFISRHDLNWSVKADIVKGDIVNTTDKFQDFVDSSNSYNKEYEVTTYLARDLYHNEAKLYNDKNLTKGGYYGAVIYVTDDHDYVWRKMGLHIYVGSIIITKIYNSSGWIKPNEQITPNEYECAVGADMHVESLRENEGVNNIYSPGNPTPNLQYDETFGFEDYNWSFYYGNNITIENITIGYRALRVMDPGFESYVYIECNTTNPTRLVDEHYTNDNANPPPWEYFEINNLGMNYTYEKNWAFNLTTISVSASDATYYWVLWIDFDYLTWNESSGVITTISSSSSSGDRDLWNSLPELEFLWTQLYSLIMGNLSTTLTIIGVSGGGFASYEAYVYNKKKRQVQESSVGYRYSVVERNIRRTIRKWLK